MDHARRRRAGWRRWTTTSARCSRRPPQPVGRHLYLVEFAGPPSPDLSRRFSTLIDTELTRLNEDYAAHRMGDLTMLAPEVRTVPAGGFAAWMAARGKAGGQNKVPRMDNGGAR